MSKAIPEFTLRNGVKVPVLSLGTALNDEASEMDRTIRDAYEIGYRAFDTAEAYMNQAAIGDAIERNGIDRKTVYISSKVWNTNHGYDSTLKAFDNALKELKTDYLDQYLIHWPGFTESYIDTWKAMEKLYKEKRVRVIGVSNFLVHHIERLMEVAEIMPMVDQMEMNPVFLPLEEMAFCKENNIQMEATRPICRGKLDEFEPITKLAEKYGKTPTQIAIRWHIDQGVRPLPMTMKTHRLKENFDVFDFSLTPEEVRSINELNTGVRQTGQNPDEFFELDNDFKNHPSNQD
ncbi:MAG: aldo/keto reductase [Christensenellaceae bacterium]|jgi:diketogulonate reductase-like aldo/keto reductase